MLGRVFSCFLLSRYSQEVEQTLSKITAENRSPSPHRFRRLRIHRLDGNRRSGISKSAKVGRLPRSISRRFRSSSGSAPSLLPNTLAKISRRFLRRIFSWHARRLLLSGTSAGSTDLGTREASTSHHRCQHAYAIPFLSMSMS